MTSRHGQRSDRSPLHDVRHQACRRSMIAGARIDVLANEPWSARHQSARHWPAQPLAGAATGRCNRRNDRAAPYPITGPPITGPPTTRPPTTGPSGGARRDRTDDLLLAKQALSQLSYGPFRDQASAVSNQKFRAAAPAGSAPITDHWSLMTGVGGPGKI